MTLWLKMFFLVKKMRCLERYLTRALQSSRVVVHQGKPAETYSLESPCESADSLDRCHGLWMGISFFKGSHRGRSMDKGSELLAYQLERTGGSLAVLLLERFETRSGGPVYDREHHSYIIFNEHRVVPFCFSFGGNGSRS